MRVSQPSSAAIAMQFPRTSFNRSRLRRAPAFCLLLSGYCLLALCTLAARAQAPTASPEEAVVLIRTMNSLRSARGSGFLIGDGSWVVTASHVVSVDLGKGRRASDQTALVYTPWTGRPYEARVVAIDGVADIALLRMPQAGFPALPVQGLTVTDALAAKDLLQNRALRLYGFPLSYGEATVAALAKPEHNDSRLQEITKRGETNLCVVGECPDVQPGWSGGPMVDVERGAVIGVFHSLYRPEAGGEKGYPAGSIAGYLGDLLKKAGAPDLSAFSRVSTPTVPRAKEALELMAHEMRSLSWSAGGEWRRAEEEQREILKVAPQDVPARVELGRLLLLQKKDAEALKVLQEAVKLAPGSMLAHLQLGRALHVNYDPDGAVAALRKAMEASPGEVEPQLALAKVYEDNRKPAEAEKALRAAMEKAAEHPGVFQRLGELLLENGKQEEGLKLLAQASEMSQVDRELSHVVIANARALDSARKLREAEGAYRHVLRLDPGNPLGYYYLGWLMLRTKRFDDAQALVNRAFELPRLTDDMVQAFRQLQARINERFE
jgi:tetratricopeptide (TPR) repeat protein